MKQLSFLYREIVSFWYRIFNEKALIQLQFEVSCKKRQTPLYSSFITFRSTTRHEQANAQMIGCIATTAAASVGPVFAVTIMTLCAMYRLPWVAHRKCRTCTHTHTFTRTCSLSPKSTALRRVRLDTHWDKSCGFIREKTKRSERRQSH